MPSNLGVMKINEKYHFRYNITKNRAQKNKNTTRPQNDLGHLTDIDMSFCLFSSMQFHVNENK